MIYDLYGLNNFWRPDPTQPISLENVRTIRNFVNNVDEPWFIMVHIVIEAQAEPLIEAINISFKAIKNSDWECLRISLETINEALDAMIDTLLKMPLACSPFIYHYNVRPQIMPFKDIIFNGVQEYEEEPQSFVAGETGAQSSIVPLLDAFFKIEHSPTKGFDYVKEMRRYMPKKHVRLIKRVEKQVSLREIVIGQNPMFLTPAFNSAVDAFYRFRKLHYQYATEYIFEKLTEQTGTGGTPASVWLNQLAEETKQALI